MKLVYIAGPYRGSTDRATYKNIQHARKYAEKYWKAGYAVFCPHLNTAFFSGLVPEEHFIKGGIEILKRCDIIVMISGWRNSVGSINEHQFAIDNNISIKIDEEDIE